MDNINLDDVCQAKGLFNRVKNPLMGVFRDGLYNKGMGCLGL